MKDALVFATACIDLDPKRYQDWIDYYTKFFDESVTLVLINDGPVAANLDLKRVQLLTFDVKLGRQACWCFPGWKRSFRAGLLHARTQRYQYVGHIESDCVVTTAGRAEYLQWLRTPGYYTGFCKMYNFPETALQVINDPVVMSYYIDCYAYEKNLHEVVNFEKWVSDTFKPKYILNGDRESFDSSYTFLTNCTIESYYKMTGGECGSL